MTKLKGLYLLLGLLICCLGIASYWFYDQARTDSLRSVEVTRSILAIERSIGFGGFIHHFKNYALRPDREEYAERARVSYQVASDEIEKWQTLGEWAETHVDLSMLQAKLKEYVDVIDDIRDAHLRGIPIHDSEHQYIVQDTPAIYELINLKVQIEKMLDARQRSTAKYAWLSVLLFLLVVFSMVASFLYAWSQKQTERDREREYLRQEQELERDKRHADELQKLVRELERSNRELDGFAYTASHDLKEPMRGIAINANFLARENVSDKARERIDRMVVLTTRMDQLISDILFFSRLGRGDKEKGEIDPVRTIHWIESELREWLIEREGIITITTMLPKILAERSKVKTVFQNLIVNGLKYNKSERKVVEIGFEAEVVVSDVTLRNVFYVRDNGIGIAKSNNDKIFRIFSRLNREVEYGPGTGAGLSFVRKIVEDYGHEITFESKLVKGTTFYFALPLVDLEQLKDSSGNLYNE